MNVDQFREHVTTTLGDEAIQRLLDAASEAIEMELGPYAADGTVDEIITTRGRGPLLRLSRRAESVQSVAEGTPSLTTLAADDYEVRGQILRRLNDGTTPSSWWRGRVYVTYTPLSDLAMRDVAQLELVRLEIAFNPSLAMQVIGSWTEQYVQGSSYTEQRSTILAALNPSPAGIW